MRFWSSGFFMHTTRLWAMAHLTCYHCHITCVSRITNSNSYRWSHPRTVSAVAGSLCCDHFQQVSAKLIYNQITLKPLRHKG